MKKKLPLDEIAWTSGGPFQSSLGFCPSKKAWDKCIKKYGISGDTSFSETVGGRCSEFVSKQGFHFSLIQINDYKGKTRREIDGLIVHEVVHAFYQACEHVGELAPSSEFRSYTIQRMFTNISDCFERTIGYPSVSRKRTTNS